MADEYKQEAFDIVTRNPCALWDDEPVDDLIEDIAKALKAREDKGRLDNSAPKQTETTANSNFAR